MLCTIFSIVFCILFSTWNCPPLPSRLRESCGAVSAPISGSGVIRDLASRQGGGGNEPAPIGGSSPPCFPIGCPNGHRALYWGLLPPCRRHSGTLSDVARHCACAGPRACGVTSSASRDFDESDAESELCSSGMPGKPRSTAYMAVTPPTAEQSGMAHTPGLIISEYTPPVGSI